MSTLQLFDWGQIEWLYEPEDVDFLNAIHIGIATIEPQKQHKKHFHYGEEQFLYILSGTGVQLIDDEVSAMAPNSFYHIKAGSVHETANNTKERLQQLVISMPARFGEYSLIENKVSHLLDRSPECESVLKISAEIKSIYDVYANSLNFPISVFDKCGNVVIEGTGYPSLCEIKCSIGENACNCKLYGLSGKYTSRFYADPVAFICPYGLSVISMPILCNGVAIGEIKGGHIRVSPDKTKVEVNEKTSQWEESAQTFHKASVKAFLQQIKNLSQSIASFVIFENTEQELGKKEEIIEDITRHETMLEESLKMTQEKALSIQINNHFLFNTLNAIAGLAIKENAYKTYESILNLSNMFRYSLKTSGSFVKIQDEIDYLNNYIELQKLRFGDRLRVKIDIAPELVRVNIPFNCLQPILENCFTHGFKGKKGKMLIEVLGIRSGLDTIVAINDNGIGMDEAAVAELNKNICSANAPTHGLTMIAAKLRLFFGERFAFEVISSQKGTSVRLVLPYSTQ